MSDTDRSSYDEGADPSDDIKKQNPGETTTGDSTGDNDNVSGGAVSQPYEDANFTDDEDPNDVSDTSSASPGEAGDDHKVENLAKAGRDIDTDVGAD